MRVLFQLFLQRFKKWRFSLPLSFPILSVLYKTIKYVFHGTWDEVFFSWLLRAFTGGAGGTMSVETIVLIGIPSLGIVGILTWMYLDAKREFKSDYLPDTLTKMHERMLHFVSLRIKDNRDNKWLNDAIPELMHKWGLVDIGDWDKFKRNMLARVKKHVPKTNVGSKTQWFKVASVTSQIKRELVSAKEWTEDDVMMVGEWLDGQDKGLSVLRDNDKQWNRLDKHLKPYIKDAPLRTLIKRHKDYSYGYCSISLAQSYADSYHGHPVTKLLFNILMGIPVNKETMNEGLYKVLDDIRRRMKILQKQETDNASRVKV